MEDGATPHLLPESLRESKKTLAPESHGGKFPARAGALNHRSRKNGVNAAVSQGQPLEKHSFSSKGPGETHLARAKTWAQCKAGEAVTGLRIENSTPKVEP